MRSVSINANRLRQELARRGLSSRELARHAKLSVLTVRSALAGRRIAPASLKQIAESLERIPVLAVADDLLLDVEADGAA